MAFKWFTSRLVLFAFHSCHKYAHVSQYVYNLCLIDALFISVQSQTRKRRAHNSHYLGYAECGASARARRKRMGNILCMAVYGAYTFTAKSYGNWWWRQSGRTIQSTSFTFQRDRASLQPVFLDTARVSGTVLKFYCRPVCVVCVNKFASFYRSHRAQSTFLDP